ncbi:MAG: hypothetical protein OHK0053_19900 [Microscillaceae bacterium]
MPLIKRTLAGEANKEGLEFEWESKTLNPTLHQVRMSLKIKVSTLSPAHYEELRKFFTEVVATAAEVLVFKKVN